VNATFPFCIKNRLISELLVLSVFPQENELDGCFWDFTLFMPVSPCSWSPKK